MPYQMVVLSTGYVETSSIARVIYIHHCPIDEPPWRVLSSLATALFMKWWIDCAYGMELFFTEQDLETKLHPDNFGKWISHLHEQTADSYGGEEAGAWWPWNSWSEVASVPPAHTIVLPERAEVILPCFVDFTLLDEGWDRAEHLLRVRAWYLEWLLEKESEWRPNPAIVTREDMWKRSHSFDTVGGATEVEMCHPQLEDWYAKCDVQKKKVSSAVEDTMPTKTKTCVVNIYREPYDVYIGRAGKGQDGYFGNPIRVGVKCYLCGKVHATGEDTLPCFRRYFRERLAHEEEFRQRVQALRGKVLGCFCAPKPCHGDVIVEYLTWLEKKR